KLPHFTKLAKYPGSKRYSNRSKAPDVKLLDLGGSGKCEIAALRMVQSDRLNGALLNLAQHPGHAMGSMTLGTLNQMIEILVSFNGLSILQKRVALVDSWGRELDG